jgi:glucokinase
VIALDVGGTSIRAARVDAGHVVVKSRTVPTPVADGPDTIVAAIVALVREMAGPDVVAAGAVVPGVVDAASGVARYAANLGWHDVPVRDLLAAELGGVPVVVGHDVAAAGLAEQQFGGARGVPDCLIVVIGTGIAGVIVTAGEPLRGATELAGEVGHLPVYPDGETCACGQRGCPEVYASAAGIARRYRTRTGVLRPTHEIATRLGTDPDAAQVWADAAEVLGLALATCTLLLDPSLIVLSGGLAGAGSALRDPVTAALHNRLVWRPVPHVEISPIGGSAGLRGAALLAWQAVGAG